MHCCVRRSRTTDSLKMNPSAEPKMTTVPARLPRIGSFLRQRRVAAAAASGSGAVHISAIQGQFSPSTMSLGAPPRAGAARPRHGRVQYTQPVSGYGTSAVVGSSRRGMKRAVIALLIIAGAGAGAWFYYVRRAGPEIGAVTSPITRGDIVDAVSTTGTLQAVTTVQIGSQVSGNISYLGADFNSIVKQGQIIAKLDPSLLQAQVEQSRANVLRSQADVAQSEANLVRARVALTDAQQKYG